MRLRFASLAVTASVLLADCSGGGGASTPLPLTRNGSVPSTSPPTVSKVPKGATGHVLVKLVVPRSTTHRASSKKQPDFVSPSTTSVKFEDEYYATGSDGAIETDTTVSVSPTAPGCSQTTGSITCTETLVASLGLNTFSVFGYDASGNIVDGNTSATTPTITVVAGQQNLLAITLSGVPQSYALTQSHLLRGGSAATVDLGFQAFDADLNLIGQPHPNTFVNLNNTFPGAEAVQTNDFSDSYTFGFSGLSLDSSTSTQICARCLQLENPGDLTLSYSGGSVFLEDGTQFYNKTIAGLTLANGTFTPLIDFGYSLSPNVIRFATDTSAPQTVSISGINVAGVELLQNAESASPCGSATASLSGSTITVTPAAGMPTSCVLAVNRRYQGPSGTSLPIFSSIPVNVGASTTIADGTESTADISFASSVAAPQTLVITPATGFSGSVTPSAYKCWSPSFVTTGAATNEVPLSSVASITPSSAQSVNGSPVTFLISPLAAGVCSLQTSGLSGNDPLGVVVAVGF